MTVRRLAGRIYRAVTGSRYSPVRPVVAAIKFSRSMRGVRSGLVTLRAHPDSEPFPSAVFEQIRAAWGNPDWTADTGFLLELASAIRSRPGPVLDCGSGLTTVVAAAIAAGRGATVWSLEQDPAWCRQVARVIGALGLDNVRLWYTPLRSNGDFAWFDLDGVDLPRHFAVVSCDGPAVVRSAFPPEVYAAWRAGVVPVLDQRGISFDTILLDDVEDSRCPGLVERWRRLGVTTTELRTATGAMLRGHRPAH